LTEGRKSEQIRQDGDLSPITWRKVNDEPFEYAIQKGPYGDEFVNLLDGTCLRRPEMGDIIASLRGALAMIHNSTEPDAIKHRNYEHLASNIFAVCKSALAGEFIDDMHAAEIYDKLYPLDNQDPFKLHYPKEPRR
jgi:hypothetical protein